MSFLEGGKTEIVSTGKSKVAYDNKKAHIDQNFTIPLEVPYVKRAIDLVEAIGYKIAPTLKIALERRHDNEKYFSYREADILLRQGYDKETTNPAFLNAAILAFDGFLSEDDSKFTSGIYQLRARYNKGIEWLSAKNVDRTETKIQQGKDRLEEIRLLIEERLPMHPEEVGVGFHQEFLKPEYLPWRQFVQLTAGTASLTISEKQDPNFRW